MKRSTSTAVLIAALGCAAQAHAELTLYENDDFSGRSLSTTRSLNNLRNSGFNDRASAVVVTRDRWEVCENDGYNGRCRVLRQGNYPSLRAMGLNDRISSVRMLPSTARVDEGRYSPQPLVVQDFRQRRGERLFQADVLNVRAVVGTPEKRCWLEREQVNERGDANVPGAIFGAVIGGILGHQIGGGTGKDLATAGGVLGGAAIGANVNRDGSRQSTRDVQRCRETTGSSRPEYWDVTYAFRGKQHHVQMTTPPGSTVTVNRDGEPRA